MYRRKGSAVVNGVSVDVYSDGYGGTLYEVNGSLYREREAEKLLHNNVMSSRYADRTYANRQQDAFRDAREGKWRR